MKTAWLLVLVMATATLYVFDVAGSRRHLGDAYGYVSHRVERAFGAVADRLPEPPRA